MKDSITYISVGWYLVKPVFCWLRLWTRLATYKASKSWPKCPCKTSCKNWPMVSQQCLTLFCEGRRNQKYKNFVPYNLAVLYHGGKQINKSLSTSMIVGNIRRSLRSQNIYFSKMFIQNEWHKKIRNKTLSVTFLPICSFHRYDRECHADIDTEFFIYLVEMLHVWAGRRNWYEEIIIII